jgi:hypothetical protein
MYLKTAVVGFNNNNIDITPAQVELAWMFKLNNDNS